MAKRDPEKIAPSDPNLKAGSFPDQFIDRMANMDVLPWMQISERVKQIELITKDIIDLKARYEDVLQPIKDLTNNVKSLSRDVESLTISSKELNRDLERVNSFVKENGQHINQLTSNLSIVASQNQGMQSTLSNINEEHKNLKERTITLMTDFGRYKIISYIFWAILLVALGAILPKILEKLF